MSVQPLPLEAGTALGPYVIDGLLGAGGMGEVYKAHDTRLDRPVAIKILSSSVRNDDAASRDRFHREGRAVAALNHPNICTLHDVGDNYLVMELVEGETLRERLQHRLTLDATLHIARQVLAALGAAHRTGVVHRDLKPENVMVRSDGYVKVLDFGLATWLPVGAKNIGAMTTMAATERGHILGTVAYMSPEQIEGRAVDERSDLFAFGIILYEMVTGQHPWPRPSAVDTLHAILHEEPLSFDADPVTGRALANVIRGLLRKSPAERYPSADLVLQGLAPVAAGGDSLAPASNIPKVLTSIAVLPFVFLNEIDDRRALSLGFADALITIFANLEDLIVAPTSAILGYAAGADPSQGCRDLGVRHALQGTVQKLGAHWRVSVQLFDAVSQKIVLSEKHDFELERVFDVQDEIGRRVVESLKGRFPSSASKSRDRYSSDPEAYDEFMAGLRDSYSDQLDSWRSAADHLTRAVRHDPDFALAHATLSFVAMNIHFQFESQRTWLHEAEDHCRRALELDPQLPEAYLARSWILWSAAKNFQHIEAIQALDRVLAARPQLERAHNRMSTICLHIGRLKEARQAHELALQSNPKTRTGNLEWFYLMSGDYAKADEAAEAWFAERPGNPYAVFTRVAAALWSGQIDLAEQRMATGLAIIPDEPLVGSLQAMVQARRNQPDAALLSVRRVLDSPRSLGHIHHVYHYIASVHATLGDTKTAMAWLERSVDTGWACWPFFRIDPFLENLREEPGFKRLMAELEHTYSTLPIARV